METRGESHCRLAIYIKTYFKAKEELWKLKYFTPCKNLPNLQKNPLKETKILQDIITLYLISSFNTSQNISFQKSSYKNRHVTLGPKSLQATVLHNESEHHNFLVKPITRVYQNKNPKKKPS